MLNYFLLILVLLFVQLNAIENPIDSHCQRDPYCSFNNMSMTIICDGTFGKENETNLLPILTCFPPVNKYIFKNFDEIQSHAFKNITFPQNQTFSIQLINITKIKIEAFSNSLIIPTNSKLSIDIEQLDSSSSIILEPNAFNRIYIEHLRFFNIKKFNGRSIFDTDCFGSDLDINYLIFEQCSISGFSNILHKVADVNYLSIIHSPALTQLTSQSLPSFLLKSKSLEISNTSLQIINEHTFQAWSLRLEELIISHNPNLEIFPASIVDGILMKLRKLDLSYNSIRTLDINYNWFAYSYAKHLLLRKQQLDLFLKSKILTGLQQLETIDFSEGYIIENNDNLIKNFFPNMSKLISIDVSYTNFTEHMIIDLLTNISQTTKRFITIRLYGHKLTDENFCSYFTIFKNAPNLLNLELDDTHECNCVIDLFYKDKINHDITNSSVIQPICLFNTTRTQCTIETQLSVSKCKIDGQSSGGDDNIGNYAFGAVVAGLTIVVLILLSLGSVVVYRIRRRRNTDLSMEQPIENPLAAIIEERLQKA